MDKILGIYLFLAARLREPSTHASISAVAALAGVNIDSGILHDLSVVLSLGFGAIGFYTKEAAPITTV